MSRETENIFIDNVVNYLNKNINRTVFPKKDFDTYQSVMIIAANRVKRAIESMYGIDIESDMYYTIINRWIRDNYGNGNLALPNDRIRLINMPNDPNPIEKGMTGKVTDVTTVHMFGEDHLDVKWDNGRGLNLIVGIDEFEVIERGDQGKEVNQWY